MRGWIVVVAWLLSGCASMGMSSNLDMGALWDYFSPSRVTVYQASEVAAKNSLYLGTLEATACQAEANDAPPQLTAVRSDAQRQAAALGANSVVLGKCVTASATEHCVRELICYASAYKVAL
ncbi:MAG: Rcs stress response system protein RcsF [Aeromonas sp.]